MASSAVPRYALIRLIDIRRPSDMLWMMKKMVTLVQAEK